jgi:Asp-tRNA(Asn)/Glu-tRNA(Gln) amidotransferase A subunit family amidase
MNDVVLAPAVRQLELLRSGEISVVELAEAHIRQIERLNPSLNALVDFDADRVRKQAQTLDATKEPRGPLHGLPVTIKSSIATAGYRCEIGSLLHRGEVCTEDAVVVARLRAAGVLILGTTNCPEFLMAYETANLLHGRTSNPWDLSRSPGGSSGGESLYGHLLAQADAGTHTWARAPSTVCRTIRDTRRNWTDGAHDR